MACSRRGNRAAHARVLAPVADTLSRNELSNGENMATKIFVNLPVKNLNKSVNFFTKQVCELLY
jgi:hypothetical protein